MAPTKQDKIRAVHKAKARLVEEQKDLYHKLLVEEYAAIGYEWTPPQTPEEAALAVVRSLIEEFPALAGEIVGVVAKPDGPAAGRSSRKSKPKTEEEVNDDAELAPNDPWAQAR